MLLKDKVVIVSGIGPGLGSKLALEAARQGASLAIGARNEDNLKKTAADIEALGLGTEVIWRCTDITSTEQCAALAETCLERYGRIDSLLNSAFDPCVYTTADEAELDNWRRTMEVNLFGSLNLTQAVTPTMKKQKNGSIVMVNTMVTRKPMATQGGYAASKAALTAATSHLALELGEHNIRVNSTYMGWMWGPNVQGYFKMMADMSGRSEQELIDERAAQIPLRRIPEDGECGQAVIFLASDYASAITGACLDVNGGEFMPN